MILIADCGATKADWALAGSGQEAQLFHTRGFNPVVHPTDLLTGELKALQAAWPAGASAPSVVYYYGAGCWDGRRKAVITGELQRMWPLAEVVVMHDLLGAARATCGDEPGIACIMGTGSNTCLYDGVEVTDNVTNLGYMLGDEGSGSHLGRELLRAYFYRELDAELEKAFQDFAPLDRAAIIDAVYESETPNVYLASFTRFMGEHRTHPYIQRLIFNAFAEFIDRHVRKYPGHISLPIHFIGSVAFHFQDILRTVLASRAMKAGRFIPKPIDALVDYHLTRRG